MQFSEIKCSPQQYESRHNFASSLHPSHSNYLLYTCIALLQNALLTILLNCRSYKLNLGNTTPAARHSQSNKNGANSCQPVDVTKPVPIMFLSLQLLWISKMEHPSTTIFQCADIESTKEGGPKNTGGNSKPSPHMTRTTTTVKRQSTLLLLQNWVGS